MLHLNVVSRHCASTLNSRLLRLPLFVILLQAVRQECCDSVVRPFVPFGVLENSLDALSALNRVCLPRRPPQDRDTPRALGRVAMVLQVFGLDVEVPRDRLLMHNLVPFRCHLVILHLHRGTLWFDPAFCVLPAVPREVLHEVDGASVPPFIKWPSLDRSGLPHSRTVRHNRLARLRFHAQENPLTPRRRQFTEGSTHRSDPPMHGLAELHAKCRGLLPLHPLARRASIMANLEPVQENSSVLHGPS